MMKKMAIGVAVVAACVLGVGVAAAGVAPVINEFVANHNGTDTNEFIEIFGPPNTDLSAYTVVEIEGDGTGAGLIDDATYTVGMTGANGIWWTGFIPNVPENGTVTFLLVTGYTGSVGHDIDTNNDGVIDNPAWTAIVDAVGVHDGGASDWSYAGGAILFQNYDGNTNTVGGASRIPNGTDTDTDADWCRNDFGGFGLPGFVDTYDVGTAVNTPGLINSKDPATPVETSSFGRIKAMYR